MEDDFRSTIVETFASGHPILQFMPFENISGAALRFNREGTLPDVGFRAINAAYTASEGQLEPITEPLMIIGGDIDVDKFLVKTGGESMLNGRVKMKLKRLAHRFAHAVVKGSNTSDSREFNGLQLRCAGDQLIAAGSASGGDALSLGKLDALIARVPGCNALIASTDHVTKLTTAARTASVGGYVTFTITTWGQRIAQYNGIPILEVGGPGHPYATLDYSEANPGGGSSVGSSIYAVRFGDDGLIGIQADAPAADMLGEIDSAPVIRTRFDWYASIANQDKWSVARLWGIKDAAVVA